MGRCKYDQYVVNVRACLRKFGVIVFYIQNYNLIVNKSIDFVQSGSIKHKNKLLFNISLYK